MIVKVLRVFETDNVVTFAPASRLDRKSRQLNMYATYDSPNKFTPSEGMSYRMTPTHKWVRFHKDMVLCHGHIEKQVSLEENANKYYKTGR